ncbi:hypothetical protein PLESTF_000044300 [Pleodorina starrii]|nr:hypothetical protein PLESTM_001595000 [Pleodorina starrii]GLC63512.1 hypothetical protein PLESTF_000044300 [Pleodorina starrii]
MAGAGVVWCGEVAEWGLLPLLPLPGREVGHHLSAGGERTRGGRAGSSSEQGPARCCLCTWRAGAPFCHWVGGVGDIRGAAARAMIFRIPLHATVRRRRWDLGFRKGLSDSLTGAAA